MTAVQQLQEQIKHIQAQCDHAFRPKHKSHGLTESAIPGVFKGGRTPLYESPATADCAHTFHAECTHCNLVKAVPVNKFCPVCMSAMAPQEDRAEPEAYGITDPYLATKLFKCSGCGFAVVCTYWDK
jgi:hypothetical protein